MTSALKNFSLLSLIIIAYTLSDSNKDTHQVFSKCSWNESYICSDLYVSDDLNVYMSIACLSLISGLQRAGILPDLQL